MLKLSLIISFGIVYPTRLVGQVGSWELEDRGFNLWLDDESLCVQPSSALTPADRDALREHRDEVDYCQHESVVTRDVVNTGHP